MMFVYGGHLSEGTIVNATTSAERGPRQREIKTVLENRQARHAYHLEKSVEAGIMLQGWEVKSILSGSANFEGGAAYVSIKDGQALLHCLTITPTKESANRAFLDKEPRRPRTLLLNKSELRKLEDRVKTKGFTVVPVSITYGRKLKVNIALAKGKNVADKRETLRERDISRDTARQLREM